MKAHSASAPRPRRFRPTLETLEDRLTPTTLPAGFSETTFASGITNLARNVFWAVGSSVAGFLMQNVALSAPLVIGGGAKISYDLLLYRAFRTVKPPEEQ